MTLTIKYSVLIHDVDIYQHWNFRLDEWPIYTNQTPAKIKISFPCQQQQKYINFQILYKVLNPAPIELEA